MLHPTAKKPTTRDVLKTVRCMNCSCFREKL